MGKVDKVREPYLAAEQCGGRRNHKAVELILNTQMMDNILIIKRKPGIICSNDAKLCFNHIIHSIFAICLRRLGVHENPIKSTIETLQNLEHHVRTAFGDSKGFYKGSVDNPLQGIVQGYGTTSMGWISISSPLIDMMREEGFSLDLWNTLSSMALQMVCFAFVDDTDLVNTLEDGNYDINLLIQNTQKAIDMWIGGLRATGANINPTKSYWYLIDFKISESGVWSYKKINESPGNLNYYLWMVKK